MKKIFLFTLLTCFMCVNGWAQEIIRVSVSNKADLVSELSKAASQDSTEITLMADISYTNDYEPQEGQPNPLDVINVPAGAKVLLNLNGHSIRRTLSNIYVTDNTDINKTALIFNEGELHIISEGTSIVQTSLGGSFNMGGATTICNAGRLIIDGGIFIGPVGGYDEGKLPAIWAYNDKSNITINGGTFLCNEAYTDQNKGPIFGPVIGNPGGWEIKGGIFSTGERVFDMWSDLLGGFVPAMSHMTACMDYTNGDHVRTKDLLTTTLSAIPSGYTCIEVPYTNATIDGYTESYRSSHNGGIGDGKNQYHGAIKYVCAVVPTEGAVNITTNTTINNESGDMNASFVYINPGTQLTVENEHKLQVGSAGVVLGGTDAKLVVAAGATVISDGDIITSTDENVQLTMDARSNKYSVLAIKANNIQAKHPNATVTLNSVCVENADGTHAWQRFAIPTYLTDLKVSDMTANGEYTTRIFGWNYDDSGATDGGWQEKYATDALVPFQGYTMTVMNKGVTPNYTFKSELVGNGNPSIALHPKWNYLANSYTAPMSLKAILTDLQSSLDLAAGVWIQEAPGSTNWISATWADVYFGELDPSIINPMQAFIFFNNSAESMDINYENYVYKPLVGQASYAPARHQGVAEDITRAHVVIEDANGIQETVKLYLSGDFSAAEDPGFDIPKYINADKFNFYAVTDLGNMERVGTNNLDELALVLKTKDATSFTMKFESVSLEGYGILDKLTDTTTPISAESEYAFTAEDNSTIADRFVVVKQTPTAIDNIVPAGAKNGYYSMTGVYMGEDFHALPAGMYIINGKKVVK